MLMHNRTPTPLPCSKHDATITALMFHIFQAVDKVWYTAETEAGTDDEGPETMVREADNVSHHFCRTKAQEFGNIGKMGSLCSITRMILDPR